MIIPVEMVTTNRHVTYSSHTCKLKFDDLTAFFVAAKIENQILIVQNHMIVSGAGILELLNFFV